MKSPNFSNENPTLGMKKDFRLTGLLVHLRGAMLICENQSINKC